MKKDVGQFFGADLEGLYKQHENMWTVYNESIKILVAVTSLPFLAAALFIDGEKGIELASIPQTLRLMLFVTPVLDLFMIGVVINHRLVVILYARAINGYRGLFLEGSEDRENFNKHVHLPTVGDIPGFYEPNGPMGVIVHAIGLVGTAYIAFGLWGLTSPWLQGGIAVVYWVFVEWFYFANCHKYERTGPGAPVLKVSLRAAVRLQNR